MSEQLRESRCPHCDGKIPNFVDRAALEAAQQRVRQLADALTAKNLQRLIADFVRPREPGVTTPDLARYLSDVLCAREEPSGWEDAARVARAE